jgi:hypothetical protein
MIYPYQWTGELTGRTLEVYPRDPFPYFGGRSSSGGSGNDDDDDDDKDKPKTPSTPTPKWTFQPSPYDQAPAYNFGMPAQWTMNPELQPWMLGPVQYGMQAQQQNPPYMMGAQPEQFGSAPPLVMPHGQWGQ